MDETATIEAEVTRLSDVEDFDADAAGHFAQLAEGLRHEVQTLLSESPLREKLDADIDRFERLCRSAPAPLNYDDWQSLLQEYRALVHRKASAANELSRVARIYSSMDEFWQDADAQERGESNHTYWDT